MPLSKITAASISDGTVVAADIANGAVTGPKLGLTSINANNIVNATITGAKLAATTITGDKITVGTLTGNLIAANTITGDDLGQNSVSANNIATNAIENYTSLTGRPLSNRNIIINGAMTVVQRNANTTAVTSDGYYSADRWAISISSAGTWSMNVDSVGVNRAGPSGTEFGNSSNLICTTADSSLSASDYLLFIQPIEGLNLQQVKKGTANAESLTLSFWVKSSNTGTYICELYDVDNSRTCAQSYTINSAGTWEKKTVTIPPDTTGRFDNDNANSLSCNFWLAAGTTFTSGTLNTTWASVTNANRAVGQLNIANRVGNYIAFTGIQLELGTVATPFEMRSYGAELALCQRYYETSTNFGTYAEYDGQQIVIGVGGTAFGSAVSFAQGRPFFVRKRTAPTVTLYYQDGSLGIYRINDAAKIAAVALYPNPAGFLYTYSAASALTQGYGYYYSYTASAEL